MPFAEIKGLKIYYEVRGDGEEVVTMLHHGFGSSAMWEEIAPALAENGYRVITYDRRGYGRSEEGENFSEFYRSPRFTEESVEELRELLDILKVEKTHIVSQCEGGVIGVNFAVSYPERVVSLSISSTLCFSGITMEEFNKAKFPRRFEELDEELKKKFVKWHGERAKRLYELFSTYGGAYGRGIFDLREKLTKVQCPSLVIYPDRSALFDVSQGVLLYKNLPYGELCVFPRCGHNTYEQMPEAYTREILSFYRRLKEGKEKRKGLL